MPKIVDVEKKKEEIMQEALKVFVQKGYYDTKLSDISERCGVGRTTLYQYFKNKDDIFEYAIEYIAGVFENDYKEIIRRSDISFIEKIKMVATKSVMECGKDKNTMIMLVDLWLRMERENNSIAGRISQRVAELRNVFSYMLEEGIKANEIKKVNVRSMAFTLYALVETFVLNVTFAKNISLEEHLQSINTLVDGLRA